MIRTITIVILLILLIFNCSSNKDGSNGSSKGKSKKSAAIHKPNKKINISLEDIKKRGKLIALTRYNPSSFFIYKGEPMGYEYQLLQIFAQELGVELEIKTPSTSDSLFIMLNNGEGDIIAANLAVTLERQDHYLFSDPVITVRQMLIQKLPENYRRLPRYKIDQQLIQTPLELIGKTVTVREESSYFAQLKNLSEEIGGIILIDTASSELTTDHLIQMVADGVIPFTVADENIAAINKAYLPQIDIRTPLSFHQRIGWAFRTNNPDLQNAVNQWLKKFRSNNNPHFNIIYNRYFKGRNKSSDYMEFQEKALRDGTISPYDSLFKKYESDLFPWTLVAAQSYQESHFNPQVTSFMGAKGLMQMMPKTGKDLGFSNIVNNDNNVHAGTKYLDWLHTHYWEDIADSEKVKFILASYNAGAGHVLDAQSLAKHLGLNPQVWTDNVEVAMKKLQFQKYYDKPMIKYGYVRGTEPYNYVREITERYDLYQKHMDATEQQNSEE